MQGINEEIFQDQKIGFFLRTAMHIEKNRLILHKIISMTFDNSRTIISLRIKLFGATIVFLAYMVLTYVAKLINYPLLGLSDTSWTIILVVVYLGIAFMPMYLSYQFIRYSDDGEKIILRYFSAGMVGGRKNSVEIDKKTFSGYKVETKYFGLVKSITLFQQLNDGIAKYPSVYISALTKEELEKLLRSLNLYAPRA